MKFQDLTRQLGIAAVLAGSIGLTSLAGWSAPSSALPSVASANTSAVDIDSSLDPATVAVTQGATVTFINHSPSAVTVNCGGSYFAIRPGGSASKTFSRTGSFPFTVHRGGRILAGAISVVPQGTAYQAPANRTMAYHNPTTPDVEVLGEAPTQPNIQVLADRIPSQSVTVSNYSGSSIPGTNSAASGYSPLTSTIPGTNLTIDPYSPMRPGVNPGQLGAGVVTTSAGPLASPAVPGTSFANAVPEPAMVDAGPLASPALPSSSYASNPSLPVRPMMSSAGGVASISQFSSVGNGAVTLPFSNVTVPSTGSTALTGSTVATAILPTSTLGVNTFTPGVTTSVTIPNTITTVPPGLQSGSLLEPLGTVNPVLVGSGGLGSNGLNYGSGVTTLPASSAYGSVGQGTLTGTVAPSVGALTGTMAGTTSLTPTSAGQLVVPTTAGSLAENTSTTGTSILNPLSPVFGTNLVNGTTVVNGSTLSNGSVLTTNGTVLPNGNSVVAENGQAYTTGNSGINVSSLSAVETGPVYSAYGYGTELPGSNAYIPGLPPTQVFVYQTPPTVPANELALNGSAAVIRVGLAVAPTELAVAAGTIVTFVDASGQHAITADNGQFKSGLLNPGQAFKARFNKVGSYRFHVTGGSSGTIVVSPRLQ